MNPRHQCATQHARFKPARVRGDCRASVLIIVLWIALGLVALALYFAQSMVLELRASDNRVCSQASDQAIDGAVRYVNYLLTTQISNGSNVCVPDINGYVREAVPVG